MKISILTLGLLAGSSFVLGAPMEEADGALTNVAAVEAVSHILVKRHYGESFLELNSD